MCHRLDGMARRSAAYMTDAENRQENGLVASGCSRTMSAAEAGRCAAETCERSERAEQAAGHRHGRLGESCRGLDESLTPKTDTNNGSPAYAPSNRTFATHHPPQRCSAGIGRASDVTARGAILSPRPRAVGSVKGGTPCSSTPTASALALHLGNVGRFKAQPPWPWRPRPPRPPCGPHRHRPL